MTDYPYESFVECPTCQGLGYFPGEPDADCIPDDSHRCSFCGGYGLEDPKLLLRRYAWRVVTRGLSPCGLGHANAIAATHSMCFDDYINDAADRLAAQAELEF